jgi:1,2-dihydroxy-3-keto-5-methylthiopentene dioxygenase
MATITLRDDNRVLSDAATISEFLGRYGIWYRRFEGSDALPENASDDQVLEAYDAPIRKLMKEGAYTTADVINVTSDTPGLQGMLDRFNREHWHDEDEVRLITRGRGLFHIHPTDGPVFSIQVERGDMINVPRGTRHWFDLCDDRNIRAIRLFQDRAGWTPRYTDSHTEADYQPLCLGPSYIPPGGNGTV